MDPDRFRRQVEVFFDLFHFQKMGMVYEDSTVGRTYAAVTDVEAVAKERGFWVVRRLVDEPKSPDDRERYYQEVLKAHRELALEVDAMFLTVASLDVTWLPELLAPFYEKKIPVFSQLGTEEVKNGALLSVSHSDFREMGRFGAETMVRVLRGTPPEDLEQVFVDTPHIALNFDVADQIGYKIPFDILLVADEIFLWKTHPESTGSNEK
ncbi:MAG: hypothetical protein NTX88_08655 [Candidatus Atribacteria bacterium]|nr:hypothetical protein [Candidatus Atribacteria bacterium]